jgi:hypothetical protein
MRPVDCEMHIFAFDWGWTVDEDSHPDHEGVPLNWVAALAEADSCRVYALSDRLASKLGIPGPKDLLDGKTPAGSERRAILGELRDRHPDVTSRVVVDDIDLSDVPGWTHYTGWEFVAAARAGTLPTEVPTDGLELDD